MKTLLIELMNWFQLTGYRKASFDRLLGILESAKDYNQMNDLLNEYPHYFRSATLKGGFPGIALLENVYPYRVLQNEGATTVVANAEPLLVMPTIPAPAIPFPTQPSDYDVVVDLAPPAAPMVQPTAMDAEIQSEHYRNLGSALKLPDSPAGNVTLCVLILKNGFVIVGKSACVNSANFNEETGKRLAREDAIKQITPFLGWRMADARMFATAASDYKFG